MNTIEAIYSRRSVRKYKQEDLPDELIEKLIRAAMQSPTAGNQRPWHFMVIRDRSKILKIPVVHPYAQMVREAPVVVMVCGDKDLEKHIGYWDQDCAAASLCISLAGHDMGIGSCWLGIHPRQDRIDGIREIFKLPDNIIPFSIISLGYPDEELKPENRYMEDRIHYEKW